MAFYISGTQYGILSKYYPELINKEVEQRLRRQKIVCEAIINFLMLEYPENKISISEQLIHTGTIYRLSSESKYGDGHIITYDTGDNKVIWDSYSLFDFERYQRPQEDMDRLNNYIFISICKKDILKEGKKMEAESNKGSIVDLSSGALTTKDFIVAYNQLYCNTTMSSTDDDVDAFTDLFDFDWDDDEKTDPGCGTGNSCGTSIPGTCSGSCTKAKDTDDCNENIDKAVNKYILKKQCNKSNDPKNNDGRKTCFWCGGTTKKVRLIFSDTDVCTKCDR